jgi:hypothetical protein
MSTDFKPRPGPAGMNRSAGRNHQAWNPLKSFGCANVLEMVLHEYSDGSIRT